MSYTSSPLSQYTNRYGSLYTVSVVSPTGNKDNHRHNYAHPFGKGHHGTVYIIPTKVCWSRVPYQFLFSRPLTLIVHVHTDDCVGINKINDTYKLIRGLEVLSTVEREIFIQ